MNQSVVMESFGPSHLSNTQRNAASIMVDAMSAFPANELSMNLGLFMDIRLLSRILFLDHIYKKVLPIQGIVMDIGTRWGQSAILLQTLRAIYEPYNYQRKIVAFDTFTGLTGISEPDGKFIENAEGQISTTDGYEKKLHQLMKAHEQTHPLNHIEKFQVIKGDVCDTVPTYIDQHPETLISLAFFDLDLYKPTKQALQSILPRCTKGSILIFDELNYQYCPGETLAVLESLNLKQYSVQRFEHCSRVSFIQL